MFYLYLGFVFVIFYRYISGLYPFTSVSIAVLVTNLKQNEAWSTPAESPHKGLNQRLEDVTQAQQQRPELPSVILTWHACKYKVHKLHQRYILWVRVRMYLWWSSCTLFWHACQVRVTVDSGLCCCACYVFQRWLTPLCVDAVLVSSTSTGLNLLQVCILVGFSAI